MASGQNDLRLIRSKKDLEDGNQSGYQAVDKLTVVERKSLALNYNSWGGWENTQHIVSTYDFGKMQLITTIFNHLAGDGNPNTTSTTTFNFNEVQGAQAILDAHQALTELGGHPPPVENFSNMLMKTAANVSAPRTATFKREAKP